MASTAPPRRRAVPTDLSAWNQGLNRTHAMAQMRARAGRIVRGIESRRRRRIAACVRRLAPRHVVDVGCEDGWIAQGYVEAVERLVLVDVDPDTLACAPLASHPRVRTVVADATDPGTVRRALGRGEMDVVVLSALLEHLPHPRAALRALAPSLRSGGRFVIYLPADGPILFAKAILKRARAGALIRGLSLEPAPGHLHRFARSDVARLVRGIGAVELLTFDPVCLGYLCVLRVA